MWVCPAAGMVWGVSGTGSAVPAFRSQGGFALRQFQKRQAVFPHDRSHFFQLFQFHPSSVLSFARIFPQGNAGVVPAEAEGNGKGKVGFLFPGGVRSIIQIAVRVFFM